MHARSSLDRDINHWKLNRRAFLRSVGAGGAALSLPGVLAACGGGEATQGQGSPARGTDREIEQLTWALPAITTLDPAKALDGNSMAASALALESLLTYTNELELAGSVARSWEAVDPLTYVYRLRPGVNFWDGTPVTGEDVAYSIERHRDPDLGSALGFHLDAVDSVRVTGDDEVTVKLKKPDALWAQVPTYIVVVPEQFARARGKSFGAPGREVSVMGTGPYVVTAFTSDEGLTYARNDDYWGDRPHIANVSLQVVPDAQTRQLAMRSGEIDGTFQIPISEAQQWKRIEGVTVGAAPGLRTAFFSFDVTAEPWSDIHVRRAFAHALNREGLVDSLLDGYGQPATSMVPRDQWAGLDLPSDRVDQIYAGLTVHEFDLAKARQELAQSSVPDGFSAKVEYADTKPELGKAALNLSQNLEQIGIDLSVKQVTFAEEISEVTGHKDLGFRVLSFGAFQPDPAQHPSSLLHGKFARPNAFNVANFKNPRVDALLDEQEASIDPEVRARALAEIMKIASDELPYLPLWWEDTVMAVGDDRVYQGLNALYYRQAWTANVKAVT